MSKERLFLMGFGLIALLGPVFGAPAAQAQTFMAGAASTEIEAPEHISQGGYFERRLAPWRGGKGPWSRHFQPSVGQADALRIKAAVFRLGDRKVALVSLDLVAVFPNLREFLAKSLKDSGYRGDDVIVTATHTHSSIGGFCKHFFWEQMAADRWIPEVSEQIEQKSLAVIREAESRLEPAKLSHGSFDVAGMVHGRVSMKDEIVPVGLWRVFNRRHEPLVTLLHMPVHGDLLPPTNLELSGDVPGELERRMEKHGGVAMFLSGAAGDLDPIAESRDLEGLRKYGENFAAKIPSWLESLPPATEPRVLKSFSIAQKLERPILNTRACLFLANWKFWAPRVFMPGLFRSDAEIVALQLGEQALVFIPGEPFSSLGRKMQEDLPASIKSLSVVGVSNSYLGYIMDEKSYRAGSYEACNSFYGASYGERVVSGVKSALRKLSETP